MDPASASVPALPFARPQELKSATALNRRAVVGAADRRGIDLSGHGFPAAAVATAAVAYGAVPYVDVNLPGAAGPIRVVDGGTFVADIERYLDTRPDLGAPEKTPAVSRRSRRRERLRRAMWTAQGRWIVERSLRTPKAVFGYVRAGPIRPAQDVIEITQLLTLMRDAKPSRVLEIGTANGGTTYLLSHFAAPKGTVVTCDLAPRIDGALLRKGTRRHQTIEVFRLDSHDAASRARLHDCFPDGVDVLFIDGDHSYEGVRQDFLDYADLLRPAALLVFHDIVEDYLTRYGIRTNPWVGEVPRMWRELRDALPPGFSVHEFVHNRDQDGFGIGVVVCPDDPHPGAALLAAYASSAAGG